jgi:hypothetical protein
MNDVKRIKNITRSRQTRTKGDRLGWALRNEVEHPPLREIVGEGRIVSDSCCFISASTKRIIQ